MKKGFLKYGNIVALALVIIINLLAIGTTKEVSNMYKSLLTPADYTFSIWSIIYILLAILVIRQIKRNELREKMSWWFIISCVLNMAWIFAWQSKAIALSFILIFALMIDLIILMNNVQRTGTLTKMAVGLYTGWINVAMLANLGALFTRYNWTVFGTTGQVDAVIGLVFGLLWISFFILAYSNIYYAIGAIWGYLGITIASAYVGIKLLATVCMVVFAVITILKTMTQKSVDVQCDC